MPVNLPNVNISPSVGGFAAPPNPSPGLSEAATAFVNAYLAANEERGLNSRSSAELDVRKQQHALDVAKEKTRQEELKHQQIIAQAQGDATLALLEGVIPSMQANGQMQQMTQSLGPQGGQGVPQAPPQLTPSQPVPAHREQAVASVLGRLAPDAQIKFMTAVAAIPDDGRMEFVDHLLPLINQLIPTEGARAGLDARAGMAGTGANLGKKVTAFFNKEGQRVAEDLEFMDPSKADKPSERATLAAGFLTQAAPAATIMDNIVRETGGMSPVGDFRRGLSGEGFWKALGRAGGNTALPPAEQALAQASLVFAQAGRFFMSGQQSSDAEHGNFAQMYTELQSDDPETKQQKAAFRQTLLMSMERVANGYLTLDEALKMSLNNRAFSAKQRQWFATALKVHRDVESGKIVPDAASDAATPAQATGLKRPIPKPK